MARHLGGVESGKAGASKARVGGLLQVFEILISFQFLQVAPSKKFKNIQPVQSQIG